MDDTEMFVGERSDFRALGTMMWIGFRGYSLEGLRLIGFENDGRVRIWTEVVRRAFWDMQ